MDEGSSDLLEELENLKWSEEKIDNWWQQGFNFGIEMATWKIEDFLEEKDSNRKVGEMSVEISADTQEFENKLTNAKELADALLESLSKIPDVKVEVKGDINGDKSS